MLVAALVGAVIQPGGLYGGLGIIWSRVQATSKIYPGLAIYAYPKAFQEGLGFRMGAHSLNLFRNDVVYVDPLGTMYEGEERLDAMILTLGTGHEFHSGAVTLIPAVSAGFAYLIYAENSTRHPGFYIGFGGDLTTVHKTTWAAEISLDVVFGPVFRLTEGEVFLGLTGGYTWASKLEVAPGVTADLRHVYFGITLSGAKSGN